MDLEAFLKRASDVSTTVATLDGKTKSKILNQMADALIDSKEKISKANSIDMQRANESNLSSALKDRLFLNDARVEAMAKSLKEIASLREPVGRVLDGWRTEDDLLIEKVSVPIGVIGVIYESRPNVTADVGALCFKSGNVAILKGGKEAEESNRAIAKILQSVLVQNNLPAEIISLLPDSSREGVAKLIKQDSYVDLIVPRGGEALIRYVSANATVPVVKHDKGLCHTYIDSDADIDMAIKIAVNAKCDRPGVCNAMETLLVAKDIAPKILPLLKEAFEKEGTELRGDTLTKKYITVSDATKEDYDTEYLANILSIKVVDGVEEAIEHIKRFGSKHSEAIVTKNCEAAQKFLDSVDASTVYLNASTRFTDGGAFGFGAEVGISTNKLHARGPMGINELTTYKYKVYGKGQIR